MANPSYVTECVRLAIETMKKTTGVTSEVRTYWETRLQAVVDGLNWAPNPQGYILKGFAPKGHRACVIDGKALTTQEFTARQFAYALKKGYMGNIDAMMRKVSKEAIASGVFFSEARQDSQYGTKEARELGDKLVATGNKEVRKTGASLVESLEQAKQSNMGSIVMQKSFELETLLKTFQAKKEVKEVKEFK